MCLASVFGFDPLARQLLRKAVEDQDIFFELTVEEPMDLRKLRLTVVDRMNFDDGGWLIALGWITRLVALDQVQPVEFRIFDEVGKHD